MIFVLFSISILVFLIFFATPGVDPAARIAGRNADQLTLEQVRHSFELDKPLPLRYFSMMKHLFVSQDLTSYVNRGAKVIPQLTQAIPATFSLVIGAAIIWLLENRIESLFGQAIYLLSCGSRQAYFQGILTSVGRYPFPLIRKRSPA